MDKTIDTQMLKRKAAETRKNIIKIAYNAIGPTHPGPALSCADIITALYYYSMNINPLSPHWEDRDRFILSKGHACPAIYSVLAQLGFFPEKWLKSVRGINSNLQGHPDMNKTPGIDMTTGSLGNGLSIGLGMAYYLSNRKKDSKVYVLIGDGECQEGAIWEAAMSASALDLDNLICIIDNNHFQSCGETEKIVSMDPIADKWKAMKWNTIEIDGHNMNDIIKALESAGGTIGKPTVIIAETIKGKGISFMENNNAWHQKSLSEDQYIKAILECEVHI